MAIKTTQWSPDTCECVIEYEWDNASSEDTRVHTPARSIHLCAQHAALNTPALHFSVLTEENPRKNAFVERLTIWATANEPSWVTTDSEGNTTIDRSKVSWYWDNAVRPRVLHVMIVGIKNPQRTQLNTIIDSTPKLSGRVVVD